jgi:hypothetical protein
MNLCDRCLATKKVLFFIFFLFPPRLSVHFVLRLNNIKDKTLPVLHNK